MSDPADGSRKDGPQDPAEAGRPAWREEFSYARGEEQYVSRRQFTKFLVLTSLGFFVGNAWILARSLWKRKEGLPAPRRICQVDEVAVDGVRLFGYPTADDPCILVRTGTDSFVAYSQKCTHLSCAVYYQAAQRRLACPCHEGFFSVKDGRVLQGPPPRPLPRIRLARRGDTLWAVGIDVEGGDPAASGAGGAASCRKV
jgi:Rieske Fe-S protein